MSQELESGVVTLLDAVAYQTGAVVSRTLLKRASGTVTGFAFDAGEGLSEHTAAFEALLLGIDGEAQISISGTEHRLRAGELLRLPAREPHAVQALSPFKMLLIMLKD